MKVIESDDVAKAIADEVASCNINKLVIGVQSQGIFTWYSSNVLKEYAAFSLILLYIYRKIEKNYYIELQLRNLAIYMLYFLMLLLLHNFCQ